MKRTTIQMSDDLHDRLRHEAARRQTTMTELVNEALKAHLGMGRRRRLIGAKSGRSGYNDTAERIEEIIREGIARSS